MENVIRLLSEIDKSSAGVYRKFMTTDEVKICNKLVVGGLLYKGKPDEKNATIAYFITDSGRKFLEDYEQ
jgi:predicted transcriptional regulator